MQRNIIHQNATVENHRQLADGTFQLTLSVEQELPEVKAGQFVMLRLPKRTDPLLGRPLAVYRSNTYSLEVLYLAVGKMTQQLTGVRRGGVLECWTPLGNGFPQNADIQHTILVAGGIGHTPFLKLLNGYNRCTLLYGARTKNRLVSLNDFHCETRTATDDGSEGHHGFVTDLIETVYRPQESTQIFCCGPEPMLKAAFAVAKKLSLPCRVSLETPMSCGLGICFGCVVNVKRAGGWDYCRTCVDGPVFDAYQLY